MSVTSTPRSYDNKKQRSKTSRLWIALSFSLSAAILAWAFTLPFRQPGKPLVGAMKSQRTEGLFQSAGRIQQRQSDAEQFRFAAIEMDKEFMKTLAKRNEQEPGQGIEEVRARWTRRVEVVNSQVARLGKAKEGSPEWLYARELQESLQDGPQ